MQSIQFRSMVNSDHSAYPQVKKWVKKEPEELIPLVKPQRQNVENRNRIMH